MFFFYYLHVYLESIYVENITLRKRFLIRKKLLFRLLTYINVNLKEHIREVGAGKYDGILNLDEEFFILTE